MTEFWKSTKKWHCKYCDIHINDDAPSRQLHETGFRHIGNKERHLRDIYKSGERKQKDADHEKKEIARMEKAAQAAYALDVASGAVPPSSTTPSTSASKPAPPAKPKTKYDSYTTAADLGFTDPDAVEEVPLDPKEEEEREQRKLEGRVGTWEVVAPPPAPASPPPAPGSDYPPTNSGEASGSRDRNRTGPGVRVVPKGDHDDDAAESRAFKFVRKDKRPLNWSMGHEDEGEIVVKVKEKEEGLMAKKRKLEDEERERERQEKEKLVWKPVVWGSRIGGGVEGESVGGGVEAGGPEGGIVVGEGETVVVKEEETASEEEKKVEDEVAAPPAAPLFKKRRGAPAGVGKKPKF